MTSAPLLPALFIGHGNPMFAIEDNAYTEAWAQIAAKLPRPRAILAVSAHWYTNGSAVTVMEQPRTIHDFGGFPQALFDVQYPAPGSPELAARVRELLAPIEVHEDRSWGLDHGTWAVLKRLYPAADIPVIQLSIDARQPAAWHHAMGAKLAALRSEGVLILGSGNVVHNLRAMVWQAGAPAHDWAARFNTRMREAILAGDDASVIEAAGPARDADARMSIPTDEHFLPLLYVLGATQQGEARSIPVDGIDGAAISMMSVQVGA